MSPPPQQFRVSYSLATEAAATRNGVAFGDPNLQNLRALSDLLGVQVPEDPRLVFLREREPYSTPEIIATQSVPTKDPDEPYQLVRQPEVADPEDILVRLEGNSVNDLSVTYAIATALMQRKRAAQGTRGKKVGLWLTGLGSAGFVAGEATESRLNALGVAVLIGGLSLIGYFGSRGPARLSNKMFDRVVEFAQTHPPVKVVPRSD